MKKVVLGLLSVIFIGIGCSESQKQQSPVIPTTSSLSTNVLVMEGDTPLISASRRGDVKAAKALLASGADVNATNAKGFTPLMVASQEGNVDVINVLATDKKIDLEAMNWNADTALLIAVQNNRLEAVKTLLNIGAQPNYAKAGMTVLIAASYKGNPDIVRALLEAGADPNMVDENNESALDVAINTNKPAVVAVLREYQSKK